jgi:hypothetical protein
MGRERSGNEQGSDAHLLQPYSMVSIERYKS